MENLRKSIAENPTDLILLFVTAALYLLNNLILKQNTRGVLREFLICYFNDVMAPIALLAYSNILLGTTGKRLCSIRHILLFCLCAGFVWDGSLRYDCLPVRWKRVLDNVAYRKLRKESTIKGRLIGRILMIGFGKRLRALRR